MRKLVQEAVVAMSTGRKRGYVPERGDIIWIEFDPQSGREQAGLRPALTLSPKLYNDKTGLGLFCPITTAIKDYPFETKLPDACAIRGAVLSDHIKNMDWRSRNAKFIMAIDDHTLDDVTKKVALLLGLKPSAAPF
jgi:mRNA interferase MazF